MVVVGGGRGVRRKVKGGREEGLYFDGTSTELLCEYNLRDHFGQVLAGALRSMGGEFEGWALLHTRFRPHPTRPHPTRPHPLQLPPRREGIAELV